VAELTYRGAARGGRFLPARLIQPCPKTNCIKPSQYAKSKEGLIDEISAEGVFATDGESSTGCQAVE
jgi:hypothetical protein